MPQGKPKDVINDEFPLGPGTFALETSNGRWRAFKHLILVVELLMYMVDGKFNRLMVFMPPRHGKSWLISKYFLTWFLGSFPDLRIILATHMASFSAKWGRISKQLLEHYGKKLFVKEMLTEEGERVLVNNKVKLDKSSQASYRWDIEGHDGGLVTTGIGGGLLGEGMHGGIIDDPTKGFKKANSKTHQQELNDWYYTEFKTRADKDLTTGKYPWIVYIAQRLNKKDLAGQILNGFTEEDPGEPHIDVREALEILRGGGSIPMGTWVVLNLPAIADEDDILGRSPGEALCPQIMNEEDIEQIRSEMGSFRFEAIYQGNPQEREGKIFKRHWFLDERGEVLASVLTNSQRLPKLLNEARYWDFGASGDEGDETCGMRGAYNENKLTFRCMVYDKFTAKQSLYKYKSTTKKDGLPVVSIIEQEPASESKMLIQELMDLDELTWHDIQKDKVSGSKIDRAFHLEVMAETGRVQFDTNHMSMAEIKMCIDNLIEFTGEDGNEDHTVDTMTGLANYFMLNEGAEIYI